MLITPILRLAADFKPQDREPSVALPHTHALKG
jgi:hypothetical protein